MKPPPNSLTRRFYTWAAAAGLSALGDSLTFFALAWVAAGHGPAAASLVLMAGSVPLCALILVGGVAADRWGVQAVMVACDGVMAVVMAAFAIGALIAAPVWALAVVSGLSGTAAALRRPAAQVFPRLFARDQELSRLMAGVTLLLQLARVTGPVVAGAVVATGGLPATSALDAASFAVVAVVLARVHPPLAPQRIPSPSGWSRQLREGVREAVTARGVPSALAAVCGLAVTILPLVDLCVPLAGHSHHWGAGGTSLVTAGWPAGGMSVMAIVARRGAPGPRVAAVGPVLAAAGGLLLLLGDRVVTGVLALVLVGAGTSMTTARLLPLLVDATPAPLLARFASLLQLAQIAPVLLATPALGAAAAAWGVDVAIAVLTATLLVTSVVVVRADRALAAPPLAQCAVASAPA